MAPTVLVFAPGQTVRTVAVSVRGDALVERDERYAVNLSSPVATTIAVGQGMGTIVNDD